MVMDNITDSFVHYLFHKAETIVEPVKEKAASCETDYKGVVLAGAAKNKARWIPIIEFAGEGMAEVIGYDIRTDEKTAAFINGFNAHSLELDDGQRFAMIHLGASIISALKAVKDTHHISEESLEIGIIMGYEAACRVAIAMQPFHKNKGYHTAGTCGTIGSAVAIAFAMRMNQAQLKRALTAAAGSAAGMLEMQEQGSEMKPYNIGRAAMDGLTAAYMGLTDFVAPDDILGGERGFYNNFSTEFDAEKLIKETEYFEIERIYVKPYASCRHSHSAVEAAIKLHNKMKADDIKSVLVETYKLGVKGHDHTDIRGIASAKLSTPYAVAAGLIYGKADLSVFEPLDERVIELARKIKVIESPDLTAVSGRKRTAIVTVTTVERDQFIERIDYAKGDPENPMTGEEIEEKERSLAEYAGRLKEKQNE